MGIEHKQQCSSHIVITKKLIVLAVFLLSYGYTGYKQDAWWLHNYLRQGVRKVIPSCTLLAIREA